MLSYEMKKKKDLNFIPLNQLYCSQSDMTSVIIPKTKIDHVIVNAVVTFHDELQMSGAFDRVKWKTEYENYIYAEFKRE